MAATVATAMSHSMPPLPMTSAPRIRPPRIPKGTPNINSQPQPEGEAPKDKLWVQGRWRNPASRAARHRQEIYSRRVEKALKHEILGMNIYAYNHIRTKQVVYSLTRNMENNKIMEQLLFHGKKTVPAALRRDMWTPYFSLHFPPTMHGAEAGMLAYRRLREFSLQRQLSPPREMVATTQKDIDAIKAGADPLVLKDRLERRDLILPTLGTRLPQKLLARRLMDQKATSVADARFVTQLYLEGQSPTEMRRARLKKFKNRMAQMGRRAKLRLQKIRQLEARKRDLIRQLAAEAQSARRADGHLTLTRHAAARISSEYLGFSKKGGGLVKLAKIKVAEEGKATEAELRESMADVQAQIDALLSGKPLPETEQEDVVVEVEVDSSVGNDEAAAKLSSMADEDAAVAEETSEEHEPMVKIMWADQRDSTYAAGDWPEGVIHGSLERVALSKTRGGGGPTRSVHVIGGEQDSLWAKDPEELLERRKLKEEIYKERQEAVRRVEGKMDEAVAILQKELLLGYGPAGAEGMSADELKAEIESSTEKQAIDKEAQQYEATALEHDWWALESHQREGIDRERAISLAQVLKWREPQVVAPNEEVSSEDAAKDVAIEGPKAGWFDRVKALVWRR